MLGFTEHYLAPFAIALQASVQAIGVLTALPSLISSLFQLLSTSWAYRFKSRKGFIVMGAFVQACLLLPISFLPYLGLKHEVTVFICLVVFFATSGAVIGPVWGSLMTDYIHPDERGRYFGWRNQRLGLISLGTHFIAGIVLYLLHPIHPLIGFTANFVMAMVARLISAALLWQMEDIPFQVTKDIHFTFWMFLRRFRQSNFVKFVLFVSSMTFSAFLAGPFFAVFMLRDLGFNYLVYTALTVVAVLSNLFSLRLWGEHADEVGNAKVLRLTSFFLPIIPALWLFTSNPAFLIFIQILAGFIWGGFNLAASNFIYDAVSPPKRIRCIAYFNVLNGTALAIGAVLGGYLGPRLPEIFGYELRTLFLLSGFLRLLVFLFMSPTFREVRPARKVSSLELFFSVVGIKPIGFEERKEET
ncbi:MAG: MFS transporter [Candidatus Omnitrophica bacterium]|nr:MFS transporter [Candidatus Omnitrophota bacterium]